MCIEYLIALIFLSCFTVTAFISVLGWITETDRREASEKENKELLIYVSELEEENLRLKAKTAIYKLNKEYERNERN